jgi:hypothetical protein
LRYSSFGVISEELMSTGFLISMGPHLVFFAGA